MDELVNIQPLLIIYNQQWLWNYRIADNNILFLTNKTFTEAKEVRL